jgi:hypothetical protein
MEDRSRSCGISPCIRLIGTGAYVGPAYYASAARGLAADGDAGATRNGS